VLSAVTAETLVSITKVFGQQYLPEHFRLGKLQATRMAIPLKEDTQARASRKTFAILNTNITVRCGKCTNRLNLENWRKQRDHNNDNSTQFK